MEAELFDGTVLEFPDGTDPAVIQSTVKRETARLRSSGASGSWGAGATGSWSDPRLADKSGLEKYRMGGKVAFGEIGLGINQIRGKATEQDVANYRQTNAGILEDPAVAAGNVSGQVMAATPLMLAPGGASVLGSALYGGLFGGVQPVGPGESRVDNTIKGAAISGAVSGGLKAAGRILKPIRSANTQPEQAAVDTLQGEGVRLSVGQQTGSRATQTAERMLRDNPYTGPAMSEQAQKQAESFTRAALRTAGEDAAGATPEVLGRAKTRIGGGMDSIFSRHRIDLRPVDLQGIQSIVQSARRRLGAGGHMSGNPIENIANDITEHMKQAGGKLDGKFYQVIRRDLQALEAKPDTAELARDFREGLDSAFQHSAGPADSAALAQLRGQYRNLMTIADVADATNRGLVSPAALAQRMKGGKHTKNEFRFKGEEALAKLARSASTVVDRFPNSGTTARAGAQLVAPSLVGGASYLQDGDTQKAAQLAAMTYGIPKAAAFALNNPATANYLARGVPMPPASNQLAKYLLRIAPPATTALVTGQ
jgi:hypothetical protein